MNEQMGLDEALSIANNSNCKQVGDLQPSPYCNYNTGTWWFDIDINRPGCKPACVVDIETKTAEINWRCTGVN